MSRIHRTGADTLGAFFGRSVSLQNVQVQITPPPGPPIQPGFSVTLSSSIEDPLSLTIVITILGEFSNSISTAEITLLVNNEPGEPVTIPYTPTIVLNSTTGFSLNAVDQYSVRIRLISETSMSLPVVSQPTVRTFPLAPTGIAVSSVGVNTATLTFDDFEAAGGYNLEAATALVEGLFGSLTSSVGSNTSVNLSALAPATEYSAYTLGFSKSGFNPSPVSPVPTFITFGPAPSNITYSYSSPETTDTIFVNFDPYTAFLITDVSVLDNSTSPPTPLTVNNITTTSFELVSLSPGTVYSATGRGLSSATPLQSIEFPLSFVTRNVAPQNFALDSLTDTTATFTFDSYTATPSLTQGTVSLNNGDLSRTSSTITSTSIQISGLDPDTLYSNVILVVENGIWQSLVSNTIPSFTTYFTPPTLVTPPVVTCNSAEFSLSTNFESFTVGGVEVVTGDIAAIYDNSPSPAVVRFVNLTPETEYTNIQIYLYETFGGNQTATIAVPTFTTGAVAVDTNTLVYESTTTTSTSILLNFEQYEFSDASPILEVVATGKVGEDDITFEAVLDVASPPTTILLRGPGSSDLEANTEYSNIQVKVVNLEVCLQSAVVNVGSATTAAA